MRAFCVYFLLFSVKYQNMRTKICVVLGLIVAIFAGVLFIPDQEIDYDYLRLHIRANSNMAVDQNVKYEIKDMMVEFLTPYFCNVKSKADAVKKVEELTAEITIRCVNLLREKGFFYSVNVKINNEYFPTRTYNNTTLESGYYDAVIIELGDAVGDNWWCVMYPPLCFVNKNENNMQIKYKSKIVEWFKSLFN